MPEIAGKIAKQQEAEATVEAFRKNLGPFVVAAETTRMAMVFTDGKASGNPIIFANDSFLKLTGYAREDVLAQSLNFLLARGVEADVLAEVEAAFAGADCCPAIHYRRKDGSTFWATMFVSPVCDEDGALVQHFVSLVDQTGHWEEQARSRMLIDELNHRVKNTLSTVQSIVAQALRQQSDPEAIRESIESRIVALSRSHDLLTKVSWTSAGLHDLVDNALEPFRVAAGLAERFVVEGEDILLPPQATLALSIAFHELATNAVKYGALSNEHGSLTITWAIRPFADGDRLIVSWRESGGPPVVPPVHRGFGSQVLERGLAHELHGMVHLDYRASGVVCTIEMAAPAERGA